MFLIVNKYILRKRFVGVTLWPFIVMKDRALENDVVFINHERIHLRQHRELLVRPFYIWSGLEFLVRLLQYKDRYKAYRNISFEREAYTNELDLDYLKHRSAWTFLRFL
jgi:hypothetical protein